jgi:hypothetical protein
LLRWLALAAPLIVLSRLYFTHLRVQKQIGRLILLSGIVAAAILGVTAVLMPRLGIAANGVGLLVGHSLVAAVALGRWMRQNGPEGIIRRVGTVSNIRSLMSSIVYWLTPGPSSEPYPETPPLGE